jgi:hypothetical protein
MKRLLIGLNILCALFVQSCVNDQANKDRSEIEALLGYQLPDEVKSVHLKVQTVNPAYTHSFTYIKMEIDLANYLQMMMRMSMSAVPRSGFTREYSISQKSWDLLYKESDEAKIRAWWDPVLVGTIPSTTYARRVGDTLVIAKHENSWAYLVVQSNIPG